MSGLIPESVVEEVFSRAEIAEIIAEYVRLDKKGRNYLGLCPFHQEKTPSFTVTPEKQMFYCFGCGTGGNVFKFIMLKENLNFPESVRYLAERTGVHIPVAASARETKYDRYYQINEWARDYFRHQLEKSPQAEPAREYLQKRGISPEICEKFQIGFAPPQWDGLKNYLLGRKCRPQELMELGLLNQGERGNYYDRFRDRIIFPVWNPSGRVVAFGGRVLGDEQPKYLNSPETPVFHKSKVLYAINIARQALRREGYAVIVEGYLDAIAAHQFGVENTVASLGTSLTPEQARLVLRYTVDSLIAYDGDAAGVRAALRGLDILQTSGARVRVLTMPEGYDPDDFLREKGLSGWQEAVAASTPLLEYKLQVVSAQTGTETAASRMEALQEVLPNLYALPSVVEREEGFQVVARSLGITWETVRSEFERYVTRLKLKKTTAAIDKPRRGRRRELRIKVPQVRDQAEASILRIILQQPQEGEQLQNALEPDLFRNSSYRRIFKTYMQHRHKPGFVVALLLNYLEETEQEAVNHLLGKQIQDEQDPAAELEKLVQVLKKQETKKKIRELLQDLAAAEKAGNREQVDKLMREIQGLSKITLERGEQE